MNYISLKMNISSLKQTWKRYKMHAGIVLEFACSTSDVPNILCAIVSLQRNGAQKNDTFTLFLGIFVNWRNSKCNLENVFLFLSECVWMCQFGRHYLLPANEAREVFFLNIYDRNFCRFRPDPNRPELNRPSGFCQP